MWLKTELLCAVYTFKLPDVKVQAICQTHLLPKITINWRSE